MNMHEDYTVMLRVLHGNSVTAHAHAEPPPGDQRDDVSRSEARTAGSCCCALCISALLHQLMLGLGDVNDSVLCTCCSFARCVAKTMLAMIWVTATGAHVQLQAIVHASNSFNNRYGCHQIEEAARQAGADLPVSC